MGVVVCYRVSQNDTTWEELMISSKVINAQWNLVIILVLGVSGVFKCAASVYAILRADLQCNRIANMKI